MDKQSYVLFSISFTIYVGVGVGVGVALEVGVTVGVINPALLRMPRLVKLPLKICVQLLSAKLV